MRTPTSARWIAAAALAVVVAACAWLFTSCLDDDADDASRDGSAAPASSPLANAASRRVADVHAAAESSDALIDIDDTPLPEDATATVRGTVRDDLGQPVADAWVSAIVMHSFVDGNAPESFQAKTDAEGRYVLTDLDPSIAWRLEASARRFAAARPATAVVMSARRLDVTYDFVLPRNGSIDVDVRGADGTALRYSSHVLPMNGEDLWGLDEDSIAPGRWRVCVEAPGRAGECRIVDVAAGETTRAEFRLAEDAAISGALLDADGVPLEKYTIVAVAEDGASWPLTLGAVTAADGTFRVGGLGRAKYRLFPADAELAADTPGAVLAPASGVRVQLRRDSKVTFRLVYPADFTAPDRSADVGVSLMVRRAELCPSPRWDLDVGTVVVPGGEDVDVAITVVHCLTVWRHANVRPGEVLDLGDIRPERTGELVGRVVDAAGVPIQSALVYSRSAGWVPRAMTDENGAFRFERMPRANCVIDVEAAGFVPVRADCRDACEAPVTVALQRGGVLWIRAETRSGDPVPGVAVRLVDSQGAAWMFVRAGLDDHGECAARLPPGTWRVEIAGCEPVTADVREGATTSVRVRPRNADAAGGR